MNQSHLRRWHKKTAAGIFGAATIALAIGGLVDPAVSHAQFNKQSYDKCANAADKRWVRGETNDATHLDELKFCCIREGGQWNLATSAREEKPATAQTAPTPLPGQVASGPGQATLSGTRAE